MKGHVIRPLYVVLGLIALIVFLRFFIVPPDFGVHESGYMYGWYRKANEQDWKDFKVKFQTSDYCSGCHAEQHSALKQSPHARIECENCHGPAAEHPVEPAKLDINRGRELCIRCHASLPYMATERRLIPGINPDEHNAGIECAMCHNPHSPGGAS